MEITLVRAYYRNVTIGKIYVDGDFVCYSLELIYKGNQRSISCIPTGEYPVTSRTTAKRGRHLQVLLVPNRDGILIHSGTDATGDGVDTQGCILPNTDIEINNGEYKGINSRIATEKLNRIVFAAIDRGEKVMLNVKTRLWEKIYLFTLVSPVIGYAIWQKIKDKKEVKQLQNKVKQVF